MKTLTPMPLSLFAKLSAAAIALAALTGLAFAGWLERGPEMFMAMAEAGLAWCF
jgi:hypothetical protein